VTVRAAAAKQCGNSVNCIAGGYTIGDDDDDDGGDDDHDFDLKARCRIQLLTDSVLHTSLTDSGRARVHDPCVRGGYGGPSDNNTNL
jgi:hypothetical protein